MKRKFAILLAGCGSKDGSEIHESTMLMLSIKQHNFDYQCFSLDENQNRVVNFLSGKKMDESRNMLLESARIARGNILNIDKLNPNDFDAIIIPGGFGVALNLSTYVINPNDYDVNDKVKSILLNFKEQNKPICACCIAPIILAKVFKNITITLGTDNDIAKIVENLGNKFKKTFSNEVCIDEKNKIVTVPFYMLANNIATIYNEAYKAIDAVIKLI